MGVPLYRWMVYDGKSFQLVMGVPLYRWMVYEGKSKSEMDDSVELPYIFVAKVMVDITIATGGDFSLSTNDHIWGVPS